MGDESVRAPDRSRRFKQLIYLLGLIFLLTSSCIAAAVWLLQVPLSPLTQSLLVAAPLCGVWQSTAGEPLSLSDTHLSDVAARDVNNMWAVGYRTDFSGKDQPLIEHWDGVHWTSVAAPSLDHPVLSAVTTISSGDAWIVGTSTNPRGQAQALILRWDGESWITVPSPTTGSAESALRSVTALGPNNVWAVGASFDAAGTTPQPLIARWDGSIWSVVPTPRIAGLLEDVAAAASDDIWAVGSQSGGSATHALLMHWDGHIWSKLSDSPICSGVGTLHGVASGGPHEMWAVGSCGAEVMYIEHRTDVGPNGVDQAGSFVGNLTAGMGNSRLWGVTAVSATNVWTVGNQDGRPGPALDTLVAHWNGHQWSQVPAPHLLKGQQFKSVVPSGAGGIWAVGSTTKGDEDATYMLMSHFLPSTCGSQP